MSSALDQFRPRLPPTARLRTRSDETGAIHDPRSGRAAELGADQLSLLSLIDGERTLGEVAEAHYAIHRFVPFTALRDLLRTLAGRGLLANSRAELAQVGLVEKTPLVQRDARVIGSIPLPGGRALTLLFVAAWVAASGWLVLSGRPVPLGPWDVLWAFAGAALALSGRELFRSGAAALWRAPPQRLMLRMRFGIPFLAPDGGGLVLLDRNRRAAAHLAALLGSASVLAFAGVSRGLAFGALVVLVADLCPFAPTSAGRLLATLAGRVDLREHARAYLSRRFLRRVATRSTFEGEGSLILSALLSLAWLAFVTRLLLTRGAVWVLELLALAVDADGPAKWVAFTGAALLGALIPFFLVGLLAALWRAVRSLMPQKVKERAEETREAKGVELASIPLFSRLEPGDVEALAHASELRTYGPGTVIVRQGAAGDAFFALRQGEVVVEVEDPSGLAREVARLGPGDCFGETALLSSEPRSATVRALTTVSAVALSREGFDRARQGLRSEQVTAILRATQALRHSPLFHRLSPERLSSLALRLRPRRVSGGEVVIREGEAGHEFFLVGEGTVEVLTSDGQKLALLGAGDHFGEVALLRDVPRTATVRAVTGALVLSLDKETFLTAMAADLALSAQVEALAAERAGRLA